MKTKKSQTVGEKLRELRGDCTKEAVANAIGVSLSSYIKYERDERHPRDEIKIKIARYYGKTVESIFFGNVSTNVNR